MYTGLLHKCLSFLDPTWGRDGTLNLYMSTYIIFIGQEQFIPYMPPGTLVIQRELTLDTGLLDEDLQKVQPQQWTPVDTGCLESLLAAVVFNVAKSHYLVEGIRQLFHLRLDRPIHQLVKDRVGNVRSVKGNNKTELVNTQAVEAKFEKELKT